MVYEHLHCINDINGRTHSKTLQLKLYVEIQRKWVYPF